MSIDTLFNEQAFLWLSVPILLAIASWASVALTKKTVSLLLTGRWGNLPVPSSINDNISGKLVRFLIKDILESCVSKPQIYQQLSPEFCTEEIVRLSQIHLDECIDDAFNAELPVLWNNLPIVIKNQFYARAHRWVPYLVDNLLEDFEADINSIWSLDDHFKQVIKQDINVLNDFFQRFSEIFQQFQKYAILSGGLLGLAQVYALMYLFPDIPGVVAILFTPLFLCLATLIALSQTTKHLLKQPGILDSSIVSFLVEHFLNPGQILSHLFTGPKQTRISKLIRKHAQNILDGSFLKLITQVSDGPVNYFHLKQTFLVKVSGLLEESVTDPHFNNRQTQNISNYLMDRAALISTEKRQAIIKKMEKWLQGKLLLLALFIGIGLGMVEYLLFFN